MATDSITRCETEVGSESLGESATGERYQFRMTVDGACLEQDYAEIPNLAWHYALEPAGSLSDPGANCKLLFAEQHRLEHISWIALTQDQGVN